MSYAGVAFRVGLILALLGGAWPAATGCAAARDGTRESWASGPASGVVLRTRHYALHTTLADGTLQADLAREMEASHTLYRQLAPPSDRREPLVGYVFAYRDEWAEHTRATTGATAAVYLQIHRGGYAHGDTFATFFHGGPQTLAVARHEGFHQYVAVHFRRRPPPFLEEGVATLFEAGFDAMDVSRPRMHPGRSLRLVEAVNRRRAWSLDRLLTMHAGDVIGQDAAQIDTFYAQAWALAHLLLSDAAYREGFLRLLRAYADGSAGNRPTADLMVQYLGVPMSRLSADYERHVVRLAGEAQLRRRPPGR